MSFNLNKLVQPECGGPNPLVAAAQHITMGPAAGPSSRMVNHRAGQAPVNFTKEFMQQQAGTSNPSFAPTMGAQQQQLPFANNPLQYPMNAHVFSGMVQPKTEGRLATDFLSEHEKIADGVNRININQPSQTWSAQSMLPMNHQMMMQYAQQQQAHSSAQVATTSAGDQLESKYRTDMISQQSSSTQQTGEGKLDDMEFWKSLSQKYVGPATTDNINQAQASGAYVSVVPTEVAAAAAAAAQEEKEAMDTTETELKPSQELTPEQFSQIASTEVEAFERELRETKTEDYIFDERNPLINQFEDPFSEGLKKLEQGDIPSAALLFEAAVQLKPDDAVAWRYLGTTQAQNEKDRSAIRALKKCLTLNPDDQQARLAVSVSMANENCHHEACKQLLEWLIRNDRYRAVNANLNDFHQLDNEMTDDLFNKNGVGEKHYKYVRDKFVDAARLSPHDPDPEVQNSLGVLFNIRGEYEKAVDCFKAALSVRSDDSLLWNRLGATLANGNKSDEAVIAYRKALDLAPGFLRSRYNLAISLIHLNTYDEAAKQLVQILNMQAAGKGSKNTQIRTRSVTSTSVWNTLRTVVTLMNKPEFYPMIDGRDLASCNAKLLKQD